MMETKVRLRLQMDTDTRKVWVEVSVKSNAKPHAWGNVCVDADNSNLEYLVSVAAEGITKFQCETYGDMHDPQSVAKSARAALQDIMEQASKARTKMSAAK